MDSGTIVVDLSSDDEQDLFRDSNNKRGQKVHSGNFVDLDNHLNSMENSKSHGGGGRGDDSDDDDCMVLDGDPNKPLSDKSDDNGNGSDDLCIVGQKGQVACRDFPHSRHICANFLFSTTSHEKHCKLCHCFVCDVPAPCTYWGSGFSSSDHCHATDKDEFWKAQRKSFKKTNLATTPPQKLPFSRHQSPHIWNPPSICSRTQPSRTTSLRPSSARGTSTSYVPTQRFPPRRIPSGSSWRGVPDNRAHCVSLALGLTSQPQFKRAGSSRSGLTSSTMTQPMHTVSIPAQIPRRVLQKHEHQPVTSLSSQQLPVASPRTHWPIVTSHKPLSIPVPTNTPRALSGYGSSKNLQDAIAGLAAALGVPECVSQCTTAAITPYTANSPSAGYDIPILHHMSSNQSMDLKTGFTHATLNSIDSDPRWLDTSSTVGRSIRTAPPTDPLVSENSNAVLGGSYLDSLCEAIDEAVSPEMDPLAFLYDSAVEQTAAALGKEAGLTEIDQLSYLCDPEDRWSSI